MTRQAVIGDLLVRARLIDPSGLARALKVHREKSISISRALIELGLADEQAIASAIAKQLQMELINPELLEVSTEVAMILPASFCIQRMVVPLSFQGNTLRMAVSDPLDLSTIQEVEFQTNKRVVTVVAGESALQSLLSRVYSTEYQVRDILGAAKPEGEVEAVREAEFELADHAKLAKDTKMPPVVRIVNVLLSEAAKEGASDIHLEPKEGDMQVRQRVDGLLHDVMKIPHQLQGSVISRLKVLSGMDIAERRRPQDGRCRLRFEGKRIELRMSTLPTQFGEKAVIRLLDSRRAQLAMEKLDLTPENLRLFQSMLLRPNGMILLTGPTGSGKSSTLYTALNWVKSSTKNIVTVEDPIEYQLEGVNQYQINTKAGSTFAAGLRSILRQDPNVILVGEIRDAETAGIALEAAQTGHLLLSTIHTNDATSTISRLVDLDVEPFLISAALVGVLAQRLVRRPCSSCAVPQPPSPEALLKIGEALQLPSAPKWIAAVGCQECRQSGYKGRLAIHELFFVNPEIRELITRRAPDHAIRQAALKTGMRTLLEDGILKATQGLTTLDEVLRVVAIDSAPVSEGAPSTSLRQSSSIAMTEGAEFDLAESIPVGGSAGASPNTKARVLVVEDSETIIAVVRYFLELEGFEVLVAHDGGAGLEMAKSKRPDVIVTDYSMPGMDGMTMVRELRADPLTQGVAVLMLTSETNVEMEALALTAGADDYLVKPVEPRRLAARVKAVLSRSKVRAPINCE